MGSNVYENQNQTEIYSNARTFSGFEALPTRLEKVKQMWRLPSESDLKAKTSQSSCSALLCARWVIVPSLPRPADRNFHLVKLATWENATSEGGRRDHV